jgi:NADH-quinone oxidoreductase subunit L
VTPTTYPVATGVFTALWLLVAIPLVSGTVLLLIGRRGRAWGHLLGTAASLAAFVVGAIFFATMLGHGSGARSYDQHLFTWVPVEGFQVSAGLHLDQLSMCFVLLITGVGSLIHVYAMGYMEHDARRQRFFSFLNLFIAAMLLLVLADNYLVLYAGWEGVGVASYLLIGFWQDRNSAAVAAKKAFLVNRVGDIGMSVAIMIMFATFGTTTIAGVNAAAPQAGRGTVTAIGLMLLLAACGKSAQFPLQSWLLDAMEGPTPVSALIHAATMVTAGVYLVVRSRGIFEAAPDAQITVVVVGTITLLYGAVIGCAKDDIKKALAGSTMSQIGYMMLAAGLGPVGYVFAIFHLLTHGFFKANMFLGAGSVMHGMNDQVDMRRFGGLARAMPITTGTFIVGYLAIIGIPPFAGYFSKDKIIEAALAEHPVAGVCALIGAGVTAFYMTRLVLMTFITAKRWTDDVHPHESSPVMTGVLVVLAAFSLLGGIVLKYIGPGIQNWLEPVTGFTDPNPPINSVLLTVLTLVLVIAGAAIAVVLFYRHPVPETAPAGNRITRASRDNLYGDAFNEATFMRPGMVLAAGIDRIDRGGVDGLVRVVSGSVGGLSAQGRRLQNGFVRSYALLTLTGALLVVAGMLLVRL